jgi:hypothetical protein
VFGAMGGPRGPLETRLARMNRGDLHWAERECERLRVEYRVSPPDGDWGLR